MEILITVCIGIVSTSIIPAFVIYRATGCDKSKAAFGFVIGVVVGGLVGFHAPSPEKALYEGAIAMFYVAPIWLMLSLFIWEDKQPEQ